MTKPVEGFSGSIWGNSPPPKETTIKEVAPETILSVKLTKVEVEYLLKAINTHDDSLGIITKLKQALVNER